MEFLLFFQLVVIFGLFIGYIDNKFKIEENTKESNMLWKNHYRNSKTINKILEKQGYILNYRDSWYLEEKENNE